MPAVDAEEGAIINASIRSFTEVRKGFTSFREDDVIMAKITPCMENGKAAIARGLQNGLGFGSTEFHVMRLSGGVLPDYLYRFIRQESFRRAAEQEMTGSVGQKRVPATFLEEARLPIPPLAEQRRIVAKVEEVLSHVNAARERLAKVPAILKRFRQAVLAAACSGRLTADWRAEQTDIEPADRLIERALSSSDRRRVDASNLPNIPESWAWLYLPSTGEMNRGKSWHRPRNAPFLYGGQYPFIQTGDIAQSGGRITSHRQTYSEAGLAQSRLWPAGAICITIAANIADSAILTYPACFPDSVVGVLTNPEVCSVQYLEFFIRTARSDLSQFAPATAQKNINIAILNDVAVPLPPLAEQHEIVRRVEALFRLADTIEARLATATARVGKLMQAVLAKAFRGELVPTEAELARAEGRDYELASALVERIRAEREQQASKPARRGRRRN
jgi:type I restriction enzyme S subunit